MAAFDFPASPSNGDTVTVNGLTYSYNSTKTRWEAADSIEIVSDTSPQLGGNLDVNGNDIVSTSNGDIEIDPDGSGVLVLKGNSTKGAGQFKLNCENNSHGIVIKGPPHSAAASYTLTLPNDDGTANQVLSTDGSGVLSWSDVSESDTLDSVTDRGNTTTNDITVNSATVTVPSGGSSGFYGSSTNFGFEISDGGVGGKTIRLKNNGTSVFRHNQVQDIVDLSDASSVTVAGFTSTGIDDNASSTSLTIASGGDVTIDGTDASTSIASPAILNLKAGDANNEYSTLRFATSADGSIAYIGAKATTTGAYPNSVGNLEFGVQNGGSTVTAMTLDSNGDAELAGNMVLTNSGASAGTTHRYLNDYTSTGMYVGLRSNTTGDGLIYHGDNKNIEFWTNATFRGQLSGAGDFELTANGSQYIGGFGAATTGGTTNWNDASNARSGNGHTLLYGSATNGPGGGVYYHPFSFEYNNKDGSGNMTQFAIPYRGGYNDTNSKIWMRSRYGGTWTSWTEVTGGGVLELGVGGGQYGSVNTPDTNPTNGGWYGYSIGGRAVFMNNSSGAGTTGIYNDQNNHWILQATHNDRTRIYHAGVQKAYTYASGWRVTGNLLATSDVYAYYSDERLKDKTGKIENALDKVGAIETFYYTHNDKAIELGYEDKKQQVGVSAQSVEAVMPEVVHLAPIDDDGEGNSVSGEDYKTVNYARLVPLLIESIKELRAEIEELKRG